MADDTFKKKLASQKARSTEALAYPKEWLLTEQEQEKMRREAEAAIDLFNENQT